MLQAVTVVQCTISVSFACATIAWVGGISTVERCDREQHQPQDILLCDHLMSYWFSRAMVPAMSNSHDKHAGMGKDGTSKIHRSANSQVNVSGT